MRNYNLKLSKNSGISMLLALLYFLVLSMIAAVILTASSVNAEKNNNAKEDQQGYLSVSSAAKLIKGAFSNTSAKGFETLTVYGCTTDPNLAGKTLSPPSESDINEVCDKLALDNGAGVDDTKLRGYILDAAYQVYLSRPKEYVVSQSEPAFVAASGKSAVPLEFTVKSAGTDDVKVAMSFDRDYNITMILTSPQSLYSMTLRFASSLTLPDKSNPIEEPGPDCTHTYTQLVQKKDGTYKYKTFTVDCTGVIKKLETVISWDAGTIYKGGVNPNG